MRIQVYRWLKVAGFALFFAALALSQTSNVKSPESRTTNGEGKNLFETTCAVCHGLGGGEHAPAIGRGSAAKSKSVSELARIVSDGIPANGMPSFNILNDLNLRAILDYLRFLQAKSKNRGDTGNSVHGKEVFFGKGECADCHAMHGEGHFLSTDLSDFAYDHDANDIRAVIANPQEQEVAPHTLARVMTNSGQEFDGIIRNENNSSLQIQDTDGQFHLFMKSDLPSVKRSPAPSMPSDYRNKLSTGDIDRLVSYIVQQSRSSQGTDFQSTSHKKRNGTDWD
jgi:cytochrome c oxidase cbb3-type subunit 3